MFERKVIESRWEVRGEDTQAKIVKDSYGIKVDLRSVNVLFISAVILWDLTLYGCDTAAGILKLY